jgi:hypothetical protein
MTAAFAIQPSNWQRLDQHGCDWAIDMKHALNIATHWDEQCTIWRVPQNGNPYKLMNV